MSDYRLYRGSHQPETGRRCAMEWVSYLAGEKHSDSPACVDVVLASFCRKLNDGLDSETRQRLRPYLPRTIGTAGDGRIHERALIFGSVRYPFVVGNAEHLFELLEAMLPPLEVVEIPEDCPVNLEEFVRV